MLRIAKFSGTASRVNVLSLFEATSIQLLIDLPKRLLLRGRFGGACAVAGKCQRRRKRAGAEILMLRHHQLNVLQQRAPCRAKSSPDLEDELAPKMARLA
jgi:hypothetical protein